MKKLVLISALFLSVSACKKENIVDTPKDTTDYFATSAGNWEFTEACTGAGTGANKVTILKSPTGTNELLFEGLGGFKGVQIKTNVVGPDLVIPLQNITNGGLAIKRSGTFSGNQLKLDYETVFQQNVISTCKSAGKKN